MTDDTKLGRVANTPEGCAALQRDLKRLERWAQRNQLKFSKGNCRVLQLGREKPQAPDRLGLICWETACGDGHGDAGGHQAVHEPAV